MSQTASTSPRPVVFGADPQPQAEAGVLGGILIDNAARDLALAAGLAVDGADFTVPKCRAIWLAMNHLAAAGQPIDELTLEAVLRERSQLDAVGGMPAISRLAALTPTSASVGAYARIVHESALNRGPAPRAANDDKPAPEHAAAVRWADEQLNRYAPPPGADFPDVLTLGELDRCDEPEPVWTARNLLTEGDVLVIAGDPKAAKSWVGLEICSAVASGTRALGSFETGPARPVVVFCAEDSKLSVRRRLRALAAGRGLDAAGYARFARHVHVVPRRPINLMDRRELVNFIAAVHEACPRPAVIDVEPLVDIFGVEDENNSREMKAAMDRLRRIRDIFKCPVLTVHHARKQLDGRTAGHAGQMMRGSTAIRAALDTGLYLTDVAKTPERTAANITSDRREGQMAPGFSFALGFEDDESGRVVRATWETGEWNALVKPQDDAIDGRIIAHFQGLEADARAAGATPALQTLDGLQKALGIRRKNLSDALAQLRTSGVIVAVANKGMRLA